MSRRVSSSTRTATSSANASAKKQTGEPAIYAQNAEGQARTELESQSDTLSDEGNGAPGTDANTRTIALRGELTIADVTGLHHELLRVFDKPSDLRLDLGEVVYMDAAILQLLWAVRTRVTAHGRQFILQNVQTSVIENATMLGLTSVLANVMNPQREDHKCQRPR